MGFFDVFKSKKSEQPKEQGKILLAMPMFNNNESYKLNDVIEHLKSFWGVKVSDVNGDDGSAAFDIDGEMVAIGHMPVQIPWGDVKGTAQYAYNWITAEKELHDHNSHAIVSVWGRATTPLERFKILSKVLHSILSTSNAVGVLQGGESLLIPKDQYLVLAEMLKESLIPVTLWVYIGLIKSEHGNSVYTYGLSNFQKLEMEIIDSSLDLEELYSLITNICSYVIENDVTFNSGETLGYTEEQKIKISQSKGRFVEGQSLKLEV